MISMFWLMEGRCEINADTRFIYDSQHPAQLLQIALSRVSLVRQALERNKDLTYQIIRPSPSLHHRPVMPREEGYWKCSMQVPHPTRRVASLHG